MESAEPSSSAGRGPAHLPGFLRAALNGPELGRRTWQSALAPVYIGLFLGIAFFDQIPSETLTKAGVLWPVLGAALGGVLAYQFLYYVPAMWGLRTGKSLAVVATSTFGVSGATWVPGLLLTLVQVIWLAVATMFATELCLHGLVLLRFLDPAALRATEYGRIRLPAPLFMTTALFWCLAAAMTGRHLVRVIAALMNVYPALPAFLLGSSVVFAFRWLPYFRPFEASGGGAEPPPQVLAMTVTVQMVFAFFASAGLASVDWGAVCAGPRDVRAGGWVGVAMSSWVVATLAVLTVAGATAAGLHGRLPTEPATAASLRFHAALPAILNARTAAIVDLIFVLTALAPACYAGFLFGSRMFDLQPSVSQTNWTLLGAIAAWCLAVSGLLARMFDVFSLLGAIVAPAVGAMAADYVRARGRWPGARRGVNLAGFGAWACGVVVGFLPHLARLLRISRLENFQPAAVFAFLVAFAVYWTFGLLGAEPAVDTRPELSFPRGES